MRYAVNMELRLGMAFSNGMEAGGEMARAVFQRGRFFRGGQLKMGPKITLTQPAALKIQEIIGYKRVVIHQCRMATRI